MKVKSTFEIAWDWMQAFTTIIVFGGSLVFVFDKPFMYYPDPQPFVATGTGFYKPGDVVVVMVPRCSRSTATRSYVTSHQLNRLDVSAPPVVLRAEFPSIGPGCRTAESRLNVIPFDTQPGRYYFSGVTEVPGQIRNFSLEWRTVPFTVREP